MMTIEQLPDTFDGAAHRYDLMVALNPGYHRHLRSAADALVEKLPAVGEPRLVDLGCGSGASTRALLRAFDAAGGPAAGARDRRVDRACWRRPWPSGGRPAYASCRASPSSSGSSRSAWGLDEPVDGVLAAYLFRNVVDSERTEVLPTSSTCSPHDGTLVVQEYSVQGRPVGRT